MVDRVNDPVLSGLIERAAVGNLDLKQAEARIRERGLRRVARGALFPTLDTTGSATWGAPAQNAHAQ